MIVWAEKSYPIGQRFDSGNSGVTDIENTKHRMPFFVLREATFDEWAVEYVAEGGDDPEGARRHFKRIGGVYFYEVSID